MGQKVLIVDDDAGFRDVYRQLLEDEGYRVFEAGTVADAEKAFVTSEPALVVLDLMLPPASSPEAGAALCETLLSVNPTAKIVTVSGTGDTKTALSTIARGAYDFLSKPVDPDVLLAVLSRAEARLALERRVHELEEAITTTDGLLGTSTSFVAARDLCKKAAPADVPVLITGATGTGKEVFARYLHQHSRRSAGPFIAINCGALAESLLESTLFGHIKGSFTGATNDAPGLFVAANHGTLFLDEIGDMPAALQVKLLRALESGEVTPVGATRPVATDVRIVSATHQPLEDLAKDGRFREDLFWRIRGIEVALPALAERSGDLELLAKHFLNQARPLVPGSSSVTLSSDAVRAMESYSWPGNLRELRHEMQRGLVMADRGEIRPEHLSPSIRGKVGSATAAGHELDKKIAALEIVEIVAALEATGGNKTQAADRLGLSRQGLLNKMARHGID